MDYWKECISEALDEAGLTATQEQIDNIAESVQGSHENYSMYMGYECIPNPLKAENEKLTKQIRDEKRKVICEMCDGKGRIINHGPSFSTDSECTRCRGAGWYLP